MILRLIERSDRQFVEAAGSPEARDILLAKLQRDRKWTVVLWGTVALIGLGFGIWAIYLCLHSIETILHPNIKLSDSAQPSVDKDLQLAKMIAQGIIPFVLSLPGAIIGFVRSDLSIKMLLYAKAREERQPSDE